MNGILNLSIHFNVVHRKVDWRNPKMKSLNSMPEFDSVNMGGGVRGGGDVQGVLVLEQTDPAQPTVPHFIGPQ